LVRAWDCQSRGRRFDSSKNSKRENSNLHEFELHRPSSKGTKLLLEAVQTIINQLVSWNKDGLVVKSYMWNKIIQPHSKRNEAEGEI